MRLTQSAIAALLLVMVTSPTVAPAQDLGRILGPLTGPAKSLLRQGIRTLVRPPAYRKRGRAVRSSTASRRGSARASRQKSAQARAMQAKPFWPNAAQDMLDYILLANGTGLWAHGSGAFIASIFAPPPPKSEDAPDGAKAAANDRADETTGAASAGRADTCAARSADHAKEAASRIADALALTDNQQNALRELRVALQQAEDGMIAVCADDVPADLTERLRTMQGRLWAMRVMGASLRAPLQKFHDALTDEQRAMLDGRAAANENGSDAESGDAATQCHALAQLAPEWPVKRIERTARLDKEQQAGLTALAETSSQMSRMMMGSCPQQAPAMLARLDASLNWLDALLFVGVNLAVAVDDFYRSLSDEQKEKLDNLDL